MEEKPPSFKGFARHGRTQRYITALGKRERGVHDIKNEMEDTEFDKVKIFIAVGTKARRSMRDISYGIAF